MRPVVYTVTGVGVSNVCPPNQYVTPFNVALSVRVVGTVTYTVEYTFDDVFSPTYVATSGNWVAHPSLTTQTTTKDSNIAYPVTGVRLNVTVGPGTAILTIIQAGKAGN
jgi:hypothetical protein